jgi:hypothetical protein
MAALQPKEMSIGGAWTNDGAEHATDIYLQF